MRPWFTLALGLLIVFVWWRAWQRHRDPLWEGPGHWPWITTVLTVPLIVILVVQDAQWRSTITSAAATTQWVTARPDASVDCQRLTGNLLFVGAESGHVAWENGDERGTGTVSWLMYDTCRELGQWLRSDKQNPTIDQVIAVHVLSHEAAHVYGVRDEAHAECQAMAWDIPIAERLGATWEQAVTLADRYARDIWPHLHDSYRRDCTQFTLVEPGTHPPGEQPGG